MISPRRASLLLVPVLLLTGCSPPLTRSLMHVVVPVQTAHVPLEAGFYDLNDRIGPSHRSRPTAVDSRRYWCLRVLPPGTPVAVMTPIDVASPLNAGGWQSLAIEGGYFVHYLGEGTRIPEDYDLRPDPRPGMSAVRACSIPDAIDQTTISWHPGNPSAASMPSRCTNASPAIPCVG